MSDPTDAFASAGFATLSPVPRRPVGEPPGERSSRAVTESADRERRRRAEDRRHRFLAVCRRELARRDSDSARGRR